MAMSIPPAGWLRALWASQGFLEGTEYSRGIGGDWPANISFGQILDEFVDEKTLNRFVVNLGANDGTRHDPAFPLLVERGYGGVHFEGDPAFKKRLYASLKPFNASGNVHVSWGFASAATIAEKMRSYGCPREPDALKIDVDGLDGALLEGILQGGIRPKAVVVEVNSDLPPPLQISQLDSPHFTFDFQRKHMRGWLGASADSLYTLLAKYDYALLAFELGTREHMVCAKTKGTPTRMCHKHSTCTHCENNMWFVRGDLLRSATGGTQPPSWPQFANAFWKQTFAFNTFAKNRAVFPHQSVTHNGHFTPEVEALPFTPECYGLGDHQYTASIPGEKPFTRPPCPLQAIREQISGKGTQAGGWREWAKLSIKLAKPHHTRAADSFAASTAIGIKMPACREDEICPYNASSHVFPPIRR